MPWQVSSKATATNDSPPTSPTTYECVVPRVELSALSGGHGSHSESWSSPNHRDHHGEQDTWQGHHGHGRREREWDAQDWSADGAPWTQPTDAPTDAHQPAGDAWNAQDWIAYGATLLGMLRIGVQMAQRGHSQGMRPPMPGPVRISPRGRQMTRSAHTSLGRTVGATNAAAHKGEIFP